MIVNTVKCDICQSDRATNSRGWFVGFDDLHGCVSVEPLRDDDLESTVKVHLCGAKCASEWVSIILTRYAQSLA